jgi:hypothetical protein
LGSSQKMCLTRFLSSAEDACNACCLISPQRPICAPQLAQVTALCSASSGSTTSARQPHLTQRRSNGTENESMGEYAFQTATHLVLAKGLRASLGLFPWPRLSLAKGTARKLTKGDSLIYAAATKRNFLFNVRQRTCREYCAEGEQNTTMLDCHRGRSAQARDPDCSLNPCRAETGSARWREASTCAMSAKADAVRWAEEIT